MNAKFEKWCEDNQFARDGQFTCDEANVAEAAWQAAIQSLEVTPDILHAAMTTWLTRARENPYYPADVLLHEAIDSAISALKEQAK